MGAFDKSLSKHLKALDIRYIVYPDSNHPDIAASHNNCGTLFKVTGDYNKGLENYKQSIQILTKLYGSDSAECALVYSNISSLYEKMGLEDKTKEFASKHLAIQKKMKNEEASRMSILAGL